MEWYSVLYPDTMRLLRTTSIALSALLTLGFSGAVAHASPSGPPTASTPDQPDVIVAQASPGKKLHFPNMERLNDGSLVAVAREGAGHTGQDGRLLILGSDDRGRTWSAPEVVHDSVYGDLSGHFTQRRATVGAVLRDPGKPWNGAPRELVGDFVDVAGIRNRPADPRRVDLAALHAAGRLTIDTDLLYTSPDQPTVGPAGAIDGVVGYWDAAWKAGAAPARYTIAFDGPTRVLEAGVALKPGYAQAATVKVRTAAGTWRAVGELDHRVRWGDDLTWFRVGPGAPIDAVQVEITQSDGWAVLAEVGVRAPAAG